MEENDSKSSHQLIPTSILGRSPGFRHSGSYGYACLSPMKEFKLIGMPPSVKEFFDLFQSDHHHTTILWIDDDGFVFDSRYEYAVRPWIQECFHFRNFFKLHWTVMYGRNRMKQGLCICSRTGRNTITCWDDLFQLSLKGFSGSSLFIAEEEDGLASCPLSCEVLQKFILQNQQVQCGFNTMTFTPSQCRTLATSGMKTHLEFSSCIFQDGGLAFVDAYILPENQHLGPAKLSIGNNSLFQDPMLIACLNKLRELTLFSMRLSSELLRMVVSADLDYLGLCRVEYDDAQVVQILINNIREGRGPKGISLESVFLGSPENLRDFCLALSYQSRHHYLKTLSLTANLWGSDRALGAQAEHALLAAWSNNLGLTRFELCGFEISDNFWKSFLKLIPLQPSLRKLELNRLNIMDPTATFQERTEQVVKAILLNGHIEQMDSYPCGVDEEMWKKRVIPALEHNKHKERFAAVETISDGHTRKAILAQALVTVSDRNSLLYALLHRSLNVVLVGELGH